MSERELVEHIERADFTSVEDVLERTLGQQYGSRFQYYRRSYHRTLNADKGNFELPEFPVTVTMELVNRCNLSCVMCYTANHKGKKFTLDLPTIKKLVAEGQQYGMPALLVGSGSEGLLYKDIREVIRSAKAAGVMDFFLITNGTLLTKDLSEFIIDHGVSRLLISLDAATPETFKKVRGKDELEKIERNINAFLELKKARKAELPVLRLSFCVQEVNKHEQQQFFDKWRGKVDYLDFQVLSDFSYVDEILQTGDVKQPARPNDSEKLFCHHPFGYLNIWSNGDITPCCVFYGKNLVMGNTATHTLKEVWNGDKMNALRDEFLTGRVNKTCRTCLLQRENLVGDTRAFATPARPAKATASEV